MKNIPRPTGDTQIYWEGCRQNRLLLQHCGDCGQFQFYPRMMCTGCMSDRIGWQEAKGVGHVISYTVIRRAISEDYAAKVPYILALIKLEEGPTMMSNLIECAVDDVSVKLPVEVVFEKWSEEISIPLFRPRIKIS